MTKMTCFRCGKEIPKEDQHKGNVCTSCNDITTEYIKKTTGKVFVS